MYRRSALRTSFSSAVVRRRRLGLEVVPAALHVPVVRVEQAPGRVPLGVGSDQGGDGRRGLLDRLGHPVGFQQHLGGGGDQRPVGLDRRGSPRTRTGTAATRPAGAGRRWGRPAGRPRRAAATPAPRPGTSRPRRSPPGTRPEPARSSPLDLAGGGDVAVPQASRRIRQVRARRHAGVLAGGGLGGDLHRGQRGGHGSPSPAIEVGRPGRGGPAASRSGGQRLVAG